MTITIDRAQDTDPALVVAVAERMRTLLGPRADVIAPPDAHNMLVGFPDADVADQWAMAKRTFEALRGSVDCYDDLISVISGSYRLN